MTRPPESDARDEVGESESPPSPEADEAGVVDRNWMTLALEQADIAASLGEVPVGCVLVHEGREIARAHNLRESNQDPTAHAEIEAIRRAAQVVGSWRLEGVTAYVTLEPCAMCAGALVLARVPRVVWGCRDPKSGAVATLFGIGTTPALNHRFESVEGVLAEASAAKLRGFFEALRARGKK
jgi:tRNA(adenine34) deaminase